MHYTSFLDCDQNKKRNRSFVQYNKYNQIFHKVQLDQERFLKSLINSQKVLIQFL
ncbi:hypothetical protein pb186bvf_002344 [Paramecium bursaria]